MESRERYEAVRQQAREACALGQLKEAANFYRETIQLAEGLQDATLRARAYGNLAAVEIALGNVREHIPELQRILGSIQCPTAGYLAAYNLSCGYYHLKEYRKGLFYLKMAMRSAESEGREDRLGNCFNQKANIEIAQGNAEDAVVDYREALKRLPETDSVARGSVLDNLGYSLVVQGETELGLKLLQESRAMLEGLEADYALVFLHLDMAFALLEVGEPDPALIHAQKALELAEAVGGQESLVNALYLCGEAALGTDREEKARFYFERVQNLYPKAPMLTEFLMQVDIRSLINLKA